MRLHLLRFSSTVALVCLPVVAQAQSKFEGSIMMALRAPGGTTEINYLIRGGQIRFDMPGGGGMAGYVVRDAGKNTTMVVMPSQRMYMDVSAMQAMMPSAAAQAAKTPDIKVTGKKETIA